MPSLEKMFGEMLMVGFLGTKTTDKNVKETADMIANGAIGWVILFERNTIDGPSVLSSLNQHFQKAAAPNDLTLGITIDGEGGLVKRLTKAHGYEEFMSAQEVAKKYPIEAGGFPDNVITYYQPMVEQFIDCGINMNLAPIIDVNVWESSGVIGHLGRAYSTHPEEVVLYAETFMVAHHMAGMPTCIKHWPGLGSDRGDTHKTFTDISEYWDQSRDTYPFRHINNEAPSLMVAHSFNKKLDTAEISSLSRSTVHDMLREEMGYQGLIMTDALEMKAASDQYPFEELVIKAIIAGNDILIFSNHEGDATLPHRAWQAVKNKIDEGGITAETLKQSIKDSFKKIEAFKQEWFN